MEATSSPARKPGAVVVPHPVEARKAENAKLDAADAAARAEQPVWLQRMNYYLDEAADEEAQAEAATDEAEAHIHLVLAREMRIMGNKIGNGKR